MRILTSAPGRICLFGEHQDYFGFPVVASAIGLRGTIESEARSDRRVHLDLLDLGTSREWDLDSLPEPGPRDYWLSALHVAKKEGWLPPVGWNARVTSQIPQQAGASSSSALTAAWCALIALRNGRVVDDEAGREWIAHATWRSEVQWFNEPGGMMDQVMCAMGGTRKIEFTPKFQTTQLPKPEGVWTLIDSHQPKETLSILSSAKERRLELISQWGVGLGEEWPDVFPARPQDWNAAEHRLMDATIGIREVSSRGGGLLTSQPRAIEGIGELLTAHHHWLSHGLEVSTPKIDGLLEASIAAGAFGGKINGSGGGGTSFVVSNDEAVQAIHRTLTERDAEAIPVELGAPGIEVIRVS